MIYIYADHDHHIYNGLDNKENTKTMVIATTTTKAMDIQRRRDDFSATRSMTFDGSNYGHHNHHQSTCNAVGMSIMTNGPKTSSSVYSGASSLSSEGSPPENHFHICVDPAIDPDDDEDDVYDDENDCDKKKRQRTISSQHSDSSSLCYECQHCSIGERNQLQVDHNLLKPNGYVTQFDNKSICYLFTLYFFFMVGLNQQFININCKQYKQ